MVDNEGVRYDSGAEDATCFQVPESIGMCEVEECGAEVWREHDCAERRARFGVGTGFEGDLFEYFESVSQDAPFCYSYLAVHSISNVRDSETDCVVVVGLGYACWCGNGRSVRYCDDGLGLGD